MTIQLEQIELIWGVSAIAKIIGRTERQTFHMVKTGELPVRKIGSRYVVERNKLIAFFKGDAA